MFVFGWVVATIGIAGLITAEVLEIIKHERIYMQITKVCIGIVGIGGLIVGLSAL